MFMIGTLKMDGAGGDGGAGGGTGGTGGQPAFYEGFQDAEVKSFATTKGWTNAEAAVKSAMHLEKKMGGPADEIFRISKDTTPEALRGLYTKLGLPETPDKYEIPLLKDQKGDEPHIKHMREVFHKAGVPASMAKTIVAEWNGFAEKAMSEAETTYQAQLAVDKQNLAKEWGNGSEKQLTLAQSAATKLGFSEAFIDNMQREQGYAATMKFFANLGTQLGEDKFIDSNNHGGNDMTPEQAKQKLAELEKDPEFIKALLNNDHTKHKEVLQQKQNLYKIMHPG